MNPTNHSCTTAQTPAREVARWAVWSCAVLLVAAAVLTLIGDAVTWQPQREHVDELDGVGRLLGLLAVALSLRGAPRSLSPASVMR
jgi:hypothetical protein